MLIVGSVLLPINQVFPQAIMLTVSMLNGVSIYNIQRDYSTESTGVVRLLYLIYHQTQRRDNRYTL